VLLVLLDCEELGLVLLLVHGELPAEAEAFVASRESAHKGKEAFVRVKVVAQVLEQRKPLFALWTRVLLGAMQFVVPLQREGSSVGFGAAKLGAAIESFGHY